MGQHNILIIDDKVPDPHFGAGFPRAHKLLLSLFRLGHKMYFYPNIKSTLKDLNVAKLKEFNIDVVDDLEKLPQDIDLIIVSRPHNAHYYLPVARKTLPHAKAIYDTEALWYRRYDLQLKFTGRLPGWAYRYDELGMARGVDLCWVVNDEEKGILEENGVKKVAKLPHALDPHWEGKNFDYRRDYLVVGGILENDSSNEDGLWNYLSSAWEMVREPGIFMSVTGHATADRLQAENFAKRFFDVKLMGHVNDLIPLYESHKVFVAATRFATGIPWKVHEAMANGIPCVISRLLADQLKLVPDRDAMVCDSPNDYFEKSRLLYHNRRVWEDMRHYGYELVKKDCDSDKFKNIINESIEGLFV